MPQIDSRLISYEEEAVISAAQEFKVEVEKNKKNKVLDTFIKSETFNTENMMKLLDIYKDIKSKSKTPPPLNIDLTSDETDTFESIFGDKVTAVKERITKKGIKDLYKIQMLGEALEFQPKFCPGGFKTNGILGEI